MIESLMFALIEKGVLTGNDALSVVETVAHVKRGAAEGNDAAAAQAAADLKVLRRLYSSFEALEDQPKAVSFDSENVHWLRPPLHGDHPEFPSDD